MERINVTKTFLPPLEEYEQYLRQIWDSAWLTNQGPLLLEFEKQAARHLGVSNFHFVTNGTLALQAALHSLDITEGEVITTPFSYVATTSSILWERCRPVFVDIRPHDFLMDPDKIEAAITPKTKAIMPVHVFGYPCDIEKIGVIAKKHRLPVIYDAAHAFGVEYKGKSLLNYGDISIGSFHATKPFHTIEGGCVIARDQAVSAKAELIKHFGHLGDDHYMLGINAKASEFQAAMGLCNLKYVAKNTKARQIRFGWYDELLKGRYQRPALPASTTYNYSYYPVVLESEARLLDVVGRLAKSNIYPRRYFYPSLNTLPYLKDTQTCPISEDIAVRILCLPMYADLEKSVVRKVCEVIKT